MKIKTLINTNNKILYFVPYQHYTNAIGNLFSMIKSYLQKLNGLTYNNLKNKYIKIYLMGFIIELKIIKYK